jgi:hypothetical protein
MRPAVSRQRARVLDALVGGWQFQGWYEGRSGEPLGFGNAIFVDAGFESSNARILASNIQTLNSRSNNVRADGINTVG